MAEKHEFTASYESMTFIGNLKKIILVLSAPPYCSTPRGVPRKNRPFTRSNRRTEIKNSKEIMRPTLPLSLLAALFACVNGAFATETTTPEVVIPTEYQYTQIPSGEIPVYDTPVIADSENEYLVKIIGDKGQSWHVNGKDVTWNTSHDYGTGRPINVGSALTEAKLSIITPDGTAEEDYTVVSTGANLFIGCPGWGITSSEVYAPKTGIVYVGKNATLNVGTATANSSGSQLNIGAAASSSKYGHEGILEVDGGTAIAGCLNVALGYEDIKGTLIVKNGGSAIAKTKGSNTGLFSLGYYAKATGYASIESGSSITAEYYTIVGYGSDGAATGTLVVKEKSTADLGSYLFVGRENGSTGDISVDDSTLNAGTTYLGYQGNGSNGKLTVTNHSNVTLGKTHLGYYSGTSGEVTVTNNSNVTLGDTYLGYYSGTSGEITVNDASLTMKNAYIGTGSSLAVADGIDSASTVTVNGCLKNGGTVTANLTQGGSMTADTVENSGTMNVALNNKGSFSAGSLTNTGTLSVTITNEGTFNVGAFVNDGSSATITAADGTTCQFGSLDLVSGSMVLSGTGSFTLGNSEGGITTDFYATGTTSVSNIDISSLGTGSTGSSFTIAPDSTFNINFTDEALAAIAAGDALNFELHLILGYEGFNPDTLTLETLLTNTTYNIGEQPATFAATLAEGTEVDKTQFSVSNAKYEMQGNNLVWTGTVSNNGAVPEPATASLSLLGLAALMMRRRRA